MISTTIIKDNHIIKLCDENGKFYHIGASDIYSYKFHGKKNIQNKFIINADHTTKIKFSKIPLNLSLSIIIDNGQLILGITDTEKNYLSNTGLLDEIINHVIIDDTWYPFMKDDIINLKELLNNYGINKLGRIKLGKYLKLRIDSDSIFAIKDNIEPEDIAELTLFSDIDNVDGLNADLYDYQKIGLRWLNAIVSENLGGILADEMGLGKTLQIIATMLYNKISGEPNLVIARSTLLENWKREFNKFAPSVKVLVHHGSERTGLYKTFFDYDVIITSYGSILRDLPIFKMLKWNIVSLDEAQDIKNPSAKRTVKIKQLKRNSSISITGTPLENTLLDLWSLMDFSYTGYLGTQHEFEDIYMTSENEQVSLEPIIKPLLLRREVSKVAAQLPERIDIPVYLTMHYARKEIYHQIREKIRKQYSGAPSLAAITALRQFCCHPHVLDELLDYNIQECSAKYNYTIHIIEQIILRNEKLIMFSSYRKMIDMLVSDISARFNIWSNKIDGQVKLNERQALIDEFANREESALLVLNPKAAGAGLNITAANHVIHYNPEWNPATEDQASARAYRLGQDKPVTIHRLIYADTVEDVMDKRLASKRDLSQRVIIGTDGEDATKDLKLILGIS